MAGVRWGWAVAAVVWAASGPVAAGLVAGGVVATVAAQPAMAQLTARPAVAALGRVEPASNVVSLAALAPDRLLDLTVARGDRVTEGQILGHLATWRLHVADHDHLAARLAEAQAQLVAEETLGAARVEGAGLAIQVLEAVGPLEIAAQRAEVAAIESELANNRDILQALEALQDSAVSSRRTRTDQQARVTQGAARLQAARAKLDGMVRGHDLDLAKAKADLARVTAEVARATATVPVASLEQQVAAARIKAEMATLVAPMDAMVLNVHARPGDDVTGQVILTLGDTSTMRVVAEVYETDIQAVRLGQTATIRSPALPDALTGRVVDMGHMIFKNDVLSVDPAARMDARVVEVWIALDDPAPVVRLTNLTVDVMIDTSTAVVARQAGSGR